MSNTFNEPEVKFCRPYNGLETSTVKIINPNVFDEEIESVKLKKCLKVILKDGRVVYCHNINEKRTGFLSLNGEVIIDNN